MRLMNKYINSDLVAIRKCYSGVRGGGCFIGQTTFRSCVFSRNNLFWQLKINVLGIAGTESFLGQITFRLFAFHMNNLLQNNWYTNKWNVIHLTQILT